MKENRELADFFHSFCSQWSFFGFLAFARRTRVIYSEQLNYSSNYLVDAAL